MVRALLTGAIALTERQKRSEKTFMLREGGRHGMSPIAHEARQRAIALKTIGSSSIEKKGDCATKTFVLQNHR